METFYSCPFHQWLHAVAAAVKLYSIVQTLDQYEYDPEANDRPAAA